MSEFRDKLVAVRPDLLAYAVWLVRNRSDAEDLLSDTMVKALRYESSYHEEGYFKAWMILMMKNIWLSTIRRNRTKAKAISSGLLDPDEMIGPSQEDSIVIGEVSKMMDQLVPTQKDVLLGVLHGETYEEIAVRSGVFSGTIKSRLWRARAHMNKLLDEGVPVIEEPSNEEPVANKSGPKIDPNSKNQQRLKKMEILAVLREKGIKIRGRRPKKRVLIPGKLQEANITAQ